MSEVTLPDNRARIIRDSAIIQSGRGLQIALSAGTFILLARVLGATEYGRFSTITAVLATTTALADLGISQLVVRAVSQARPAEVRGIRRLTPWVYATSLGALLIDCCIVWVISRGDSRLVLACLLVGISYVVAQARYNVERGFWLGALRFGRATAIDVGAAVLKLGAVIAAFLIGGADLVAVGVASAATAVVGLLAVHWWLSFPAREPAPAIVRTSTLYREALPFGLTAGAWNSFTELPKVALAAFGTPIEVGHYNAAFRVLATTYLPLQSVLNVMTPRIFSAAGSGDSAARRSFHRTIWQIFLLGLLAAGLLAGAAGLVPAVLGSGYSASVPVLRVLALTLPFQALAFAAGDWLAGIGRQGLRLTVTVGCSALAILGAVLGAVYAGALGVAMSYSGAIIVLAATTLFGVRHARAHP